MLVLVDSCVLVHRSSIITDMSRSFALRARVKKSKAPKLFGNGYESLIQRRQDYFEMATNL
jgi:hypothetical protein